MRCLLLCSSCIVYFFSISSYNTSNAMLSCMLPAFISAASMKLCLLNTLYVLRRQSICCVRPYGRYRFLCLLLKQGFFCCCYGCRKTVFAFDFSLFHLSLSGVLWYIFWLSFLLFPCWSFYISICLICVPSMRILLPSISLASDAFSNNQLNISSTVLTVNLCLKFQLTVEKWGTALLRL